MFNDCIKISSQKSMKEQQLLDTLFNIKKKVNTEKKMRQTKTQPSVVFNIDSTKNPGYNDVIRTNKAILEQNKEIRQLLVKEKETQIRPTQTIDRTDIASNVNVFKEIYTNMFKPFLEEMQMVKAEIENTRNQKRGGETEIQHKLDKLNQTYIELKDHVTRNKEEAAKKAQTMQKDNSFMRDEVERQVKYKNLLEEFDNKIDLLNTKLVNLENKNVQMQHINIKARKEVKNEYYEEMNTKYNVILSSSLGEFDYTGFKTSVLNLKQKYKSLKVNFDRKRLELMMNPIDKKTRRNKLKEDKTISTLELYKKKFGERYEEFLNTKALGPKRSEKKKEKRKETYQPLQLHKIKTKPKQIRNPIRFVKLRKDIPVLPQKTDMEILQSRNKVIEEERKERKTQKIVLKKNDEKKIEEKHVEQEKEVQQEQTDPIDDTNMIIEQNYITNLQQSIRKEMSIDHNEMFKIKENTTKPVEVDEEEINHIQQIINRDTFNSILKDVMAGRDSKLKINKMELFDEKPFYPFKNRGTKTYKQDIVNKDDSFVERSSLSFSRYSYESDQHKEEEQMMINEDDFIQIRESIKSLEGSKG